MIQRRGRPGYIYAFEEFRMAFKAWMEEHNYGPRDVEILSGVNRGTIMQVMAGKRNCSKPVFEALGELLSPYKPLDLKPSELGPRELILLDPPVAAHTELALGQEYMIRRYIRLQDENSSGC